MPVNFTVFWDVALSSRLDKYQHVEDLIASLLRVNGLKSQKLSKAACDFAVLFQGTG